MFLWKSPALTVASQKPDSKDYEEFHWLQGPHVLPRPVSGFSLASTSSAAHEKDF